MSTEEERAADASAAEKAAAEADAKPLTVADFKAMLGGKDLLTAINGVAATHSKRTEDKIAKAFAAQRAEEAAALEVKFAELKQTSVAAPKAESKSGDKTELDLDAHPKFQEFKRQAEAQAKELDRLHKKQAEAAAKEAEAIAKARKQHLATTVEGSLAKHVTPGLASHVRAFLTHPDNNRIVYEDDDSETLMFVTDDGDKVPLEKGLKGWVKTDEAKHYLPPLNPGGSGGGPGRLPGSGPPTVDELLTRTIMEHARRQS